MTIFDRIRTTTTQTGTLSTISVGATPPSGFQKPSARFSVNDADIPVVVAHQTADEWQVCWCTYSSADTFTVNSVIYSSNSDNAVNFSAGTKDVFVVNSSASVGGLREVNTWTKNQIFQNTGLKVLDTNASHTLTIAPGSNLTADRTLTVTTGDAARTLTLNGDTTLTGTNTGDQTIQLTGDVTGSGTGSFAATLANTAVTPGGYGSATQVGTFTVDAKGRLTAASSTNIALAASAITSGTLDAGLLPAFTGGDVTSSAGSANLQIAASAVGTTEIANDAVTYAKIQNVSATDRILGRSSSGAGDVEEITCTAAGRALIDDADASAQRTTLGLAIGTNVQAYDADLAALAGISTNGVLARTGAGTAAARTITGTAPIAVTNGDGVSGNPTISVSDITNTQIKSDAAIDATKLSFLQAGTGAVARTVDSKLEDVVSVIDFGAAFNGTDDGPEFDSAKTAAAGRPVYVPGNRTYTINTSVDIGTGAMEIEGGTAFAGSQFILPSGYTFTNSERFGKRVSNTSLSGYDIYGAMFPNVSYYDAFQAVAYLHPGSSLASHAAAVAGYIRVDQAAVGIGNNAVGLFGGGLVTVDSGAGWGLNVLLQDAATRTTHSGTGRILIGAELDFNVMGTSTEVIGVSVGGNSLAQPTTANAYIVNTLSSANGYKWTTGFLSLDGCATHAFSAGATAATGSSVSSQNVLFQYRDSGGNGRNIALKAASDGRIEFSGSSGSTFNGISIVTPNGGDAIFIGTTAASGNDVDSGKLNFQWTDGTGVAKVTTFQVDAFSSTGYFTLSSTGTHVFKIDNGNVQLNPASGSSVNGPAIEFGYRDSGSTYRDIAVRASSDGRVEFTGSSGSTFNGIRINTPNGGVGVTIGATAATGNNLDSGKLVFGWKDNSTAQALSLFVDEFSGTGYFTIGSTGSWALKISAGDIFLDTGQGIRINGDVLLSNRKTGWTAATGTALRTTFDADSGSLTVNDVAKRLKAVIDDLIGHGLIGA